MNYYQYTSAQQQNDYRSELMIARDKERRALFKNVSLLGALLIIYNILNRVFVYVFYFLTYSWYTHSLTLDIQTAAAYIRENELQNSSGFTMTANLFIVAASASVLMLIAQPIMHIRITEMIKPYPKAFLQGAMWTPLSITFNIVIGIAAGIITIILNEAGLSVPTTDFSIKSPTNYAIAIQLIYVCLIGPFVEELIYRGMVIKLLAPYGKGLAVFVSALVFGLMHGNIAQALSAFGGGLIYAMITVRYNSIAPTVFMHILNNIIASIPDISDAVNFSGGENVTMGIQIVLLFAGFYMLFVMLSQLAAQIKQNDCGCVLRSGERAKVIFTNIFMVIYLGYLLLEFIMSFIKLNPGGR